MLRPTSGACLRPPHYATVSTLLSPDGELLVVTEKASNMIDTYIVDEDGRATGPSVHPSSGATPFGFAFGKHGDLVVSEANGVPGGSAASSYDIDEDGALELITGSAPTNQGAACWVVITKNGRYAYTSNAASGSISGFRLNRDGSLRLLDPDGRTGVTGDNPSDMALSHDSEYLYVRIGRTGAIGAFKIKDNGGCDIR
jgi:6-phosphogluconolactonase (cycloisomerase 2 family)